MLAVLLSVPVALASTLTANAAVPLAPLATEPIASVHVLPALPFGAHTQPAVLAPALKVEPTGTVSVNTTPVAVDGPPFE